MTVILTDGLPLQQSGFYFYSTIISKSKSTFNLTFNDSDFKFTIKKHNGFHFKNIPHFSQFKKS
ncbi:hypothetical protein BpHYR1_002086 [Brachionus plicatilis]|uniref:Uncharacterized protein n=1 Tax=Brachionus plicatilis TaxID=10195 RepID=A0A3M7Q3J8_BRAPC|nr:hypothetical protein BpHYR1_002086 [Brachionus plicatilis]